jgi:methyltransferase (TIGR00027 family)
VNRGISKTAIWVAAARAVGAREPDPQVRNPDHLAAQLLGDPASLALDHPMVHALGKDYDAALQDMEVASMVRAMIERTRFIDAALERSLARGISQCLIVGAGFDTHAWRYREQLAGVRVFELDRPETLLFKQGRVDAALGGAPPNLVYVAADLERESLHDALLRHGYDPAQPTFIVMEGVTMYVEEEALRDTLRFFATHPPASRIVLDFCTRAMIDGINALNPATMPPEARPPVQRLLDMLRNEPWVFGITLDTEQEFFAGAGLAVQELLTIGGEESIRRFLTREDGTTVAAATHARAEAFRKSMQERIVAMLEPSQREQAAANMREQARQNAYRIAELAPQAGTSRSP